MRVRVEIAIKESLKQDLKIEREGGDDIRLVFKYEKLSKFCIVCGSIGHLEGLCNKK